MPKKLETLEAELRRWKGIEETNKKYPHGVLAVGEKVIYKKDLVTRMIAKLEKAIAKAKQGGGRTRRHKHHTRKHRSTRSTRALTARRH
jgi:hypothetical protein